MTAWLSASPAKGVLLVMVAFLAFLVIAANLINRTSCAWYGQQTERQTRYAAFVGCMVKTGAGWVPRNELRTQQ